MIFRTVLVISAIAVGVTAAMAQQDVVKARKDLMTDNAKQFFGVLGKIQRGHDAYDQAKVDAAFTALTEDAKKYAAAFASDAMPATPSDYDASPKIWQNKADFDAKAANLAKAIAENRNVPKDLDTLKVAYRNVGASCNACHEVYRVKNR